MVRFITAIAMVLILGGAHAPALGDDWPQWRGPDRNGISREKDWLAGWSVGETPVVAWRARVGKGHSAVSIANGRAVAMGWDGEKDTVYCFDAATGELRWSQSYPCKTIVQWPGPRATPTLSGETVYTLGQWGQLRAWDLQSGAPRWERQLAETYNPDIDYGFAWSGLVQGNGLILGCGNSGLAIDKRTGRSLWGDDGKRGACASPVPFDHDGRQGVAVVVTDADRNAVHMVGIDPATGKEFFRSPPWPEKWGAACVDLLIHEGKVLITTAEQHRRIARFSIEGRTLKEDWSHQRVAGYTGAAVLKEGHIFLVDARGILHCLEWETGKINWSQRGFDERGTLMAAGGELLLQTGASGEIVVAAAVPSGYRELRRAKVFAEEAATFTAPVLANGRIYSRSYAGEIVCLDVLRKR
jgi:outer membrane protein assembly factor BamB